MICNFKSIIENLKNIEEKKWADLVLSRDPLNNTISEEDRMEIINKSILSGRTEANRLMKRYGKLKINEYAKELRVDIEISSEKNPKDLMYFAIYSNSRGIKIFKETIDRLISLINDEHISEILDCGAITDIIIAHELFHYIEDCNKNIYTRTKKIRLWNIGPFEYKSKIIACGEIGAQSFAKEINNSEYSPLLYELLLLYSTNREEALKLYRRLMN